MMRVASTRGVVGGKGRSFRNKYQKPTPWLISINMLLAQSASWPHGIQLEAVLADEIDPGELACEIAGIASTTGDPETGRRLVNLVDRLLTTAGLPLAGEPGAD